MDNKLYVGRPNVGDRSKLLQRIEEMLDRKWFSNDGPLVREFEQRIAAYIGVRHCVTICNATVALEIATRALGFKNEIIVPAYTFIATPHSVQWQGMTPVFADMDPASHNLDPDHVEALITPRTGGIIGVHVWGRPCDTERLESIAARHGIPILYDAAHAFGCSHRGRMIGNFGACEVFSFHATKFLNSFEGGAIVTNDSDLAEKLRLMRNFGFKGFDNVIHPGTNGKMAEVCAAMGLTSLEAVGDIIERNRENYALYKQEIGSSPGLHLIDYNEAERNNYQYIVVEVDERHPTGRDQLIERLHAHDIIARKYFWPGCHRMEPYRTLFPHLARSLPQTEAIASRILVLPTGQSVDRDQIRRVCRLLRND